MSGAKGLIADTNTGSSVSPATPLAFDASQDLALLANFQAGEDSVGGQLLNVNAPNLLVFQPEDNTFEGVQNRNLSPTANATTLSDQLLVAAAIPAGNFGFTASLVSVTQAPAGLQSGLETSGLGELGFIDEGLFLLPSLVSQLEVATKYPWYARVGEKLPAMPGDPSDDDAWEQFFAAVGEALRAEGQAEQHVEAQLEEMRAYREGLKNAFALPGGDLLPIPEGGAPDLNLPDLPAIPALPEPSAYLAPVGDSWQQGGLGVERGWWLRPGGGWPQSFG